MAVWAQGQTTYTWDGSSSTAWTTAANWTPASVPTATDHVVIPTTSTKPKINGNKTVANFSITGGQLDLNDFTLTVNGSISMTGGIVKNGLILKTSTSALTITGVTVNCELDVASNNFSITSSRFQQEVSITKNDGSADITEGNKWEKSVTFINNAASGNITIASTQPDTFLLHLNIIRTSSNVNLGSATGSGVVVMRGSQQSQLNITASAGVSAKQLTINKPAGAVHLTGDLIISNTLTLTKGIVEMEPGSSVTVNSAAVVNSASKLSYIAGPVLKKGNQAFTFPVGKNGAYRPISITAPTTSTIRFWQNT